MEEKQSKEKKNKSPKKKKPNIPDLHNLTPEEQLKLEIAQEIGVFDKVMTGGWRCLSAKESGKIGGLMTKRKKQLIKIQ